MIAIDYYIFFYISEKYLQYKKSKSSLKLCISQSYEHNPDWKWSKSVFTDVRDFANLQISKLHGPLTKKKLNLSKFAYNFLSEKANFSLIHPTHIVIYSS